MTRYVAECDGREYGSESAALDHEREVALADEATKALRDGATLEDALLHAGVHPASAAPFASVTKDTGFSVPHWQCRDEAGYKVSSIRRTDGLTEVYLGGNVGAWSGYYGNWIGLRELEAYNARRTGSTC